MEKVRKDDEKMIVYEYKIGSLYPVSAQVAGEELDRIYKETGQIEPKEVVDRSRDEAAPLHPIFEWNDATAAEKYRENQAAGLIRNVVIVEQPEEPQKPESPQIVRAFGHVEKTYQPMRVIMQDPAKMDALLSSAMRELRSFQMKYRSLEALKPVLKAIEQVTQ